MCRIWPSITPWNVWRLELRHYLAICNYLDDLNDDNKKKQDGGRSRG